MSAADGFPCPCGSHFQDVVDTRQTKVGIRRRRECRCKMRITTYETMDPESMSLPDKDELEAEITAAIDRKLT